MLSVSSRLIACPHPWQRAVATLLLGVVLVNLFWLGAQPFAVGLLPSGVDKLAHAALFGAIAVLLAVSIGRERWCEVLAACGALALADELAQSFNPGRSVDVADVAADMAGALLAAALCRLIVAAGRRGRA